MMDFSLKKCIIFFVLLFTVKPVFAGDDGYTILYFFSPKCPRCIEVMPHVKKISKEFRVEGLVYGKGETGALPFPVKRGTKEIASQYGVKGIPAMVVLKNGVFKLKLTGSNDIKDGGVLLRAIKMGAMSVTESVEKIPETDFLITGWIIQKGGYFGKTRPSQKTQTEDAFRFFITDRQKELIVNPWLPLEVVKSPFKKKRPRTMSDTINRPVILKGRIVKKESGISLEVKEEVYHE